MALRPSQRTRLIVKVGRVLFLCAFLGCQSKPGEEVEVRILWEDGKAVGISVPTETVSNPDQLKVRMVNQDQQVLGDWSDEGTITRFTPIVAFTPGLNYEIYSNDDHIGSFEIEGTVASPPKLLVIYPSADTVPENLLKMYLKFSVPMKQGEALGHIKMVNLTGGDTLQGTFLDLQPELWNEDNTILTLWLDPGRIKRGLIPNQEMGIPLVEGNHYRMIVDSTWKSADGIQFSKSHQKDFYTGSRDSNSPDPQKWIINTPRSGIKEPLQVIFNETLDGVLGIETLVVLDSVRNPVFGDEALLRNETVYEFTPYQNWNSGSYRLVVETRLEDLAGNNVNRLFDEDIGGDKEKSAEEVVELVFRIE